MFEPLTSLSVAYLDNPTLMLMFLYTLSGGSASTDADVPSSTSTMAQISPAWIVVVKLTCVMSFIRFSNSQEIDSHLLAGVYIELIGGQQAALELATRAQAASALEAVNGSAAQRPQKLSPRLTKSEREAHDAFIGTLGPEALWHKFNRTEVGE